MLAAVALELARRGHAVEIAARRAEALSQIAALHPGIKEMARLDLHDGTESRAAASDLIAKLSGVDMFVISVLCYGGAA